jgi:hypothetical protein
VAPKNVVVERSAGNIISFEEDRTGMKLSTSPDVVKTAISEEIIGCSNYRIP